MWRVYTDIFVHICTCRFQSDDNLNLTRSENKATHSPTTTLKLPKIQQKNGTSTVLKQHHGKEGLSRRVCFPLHTNSTDTAEGTTQQPSDSLTTPHAHPKLFTNQHHEKLKVSPGYFMYSYKYSGRHSHPAVNRTSATSNSTNKLYQLIAQNPTSFSQMELPVKRMLRAYGSNDDKPIPAEDYTWSEVFPVVKAFGKWRGHRRAFSLPAILDPLLPKASSEQSGPYMRSKGRVVKIPLQFTS